VSQSKGSWHGVAFSVPGTSGPDRRTGTTRHGCKNVPGTSYQQQECGMNGDDRQFPEHTFGKAFSNNTKMQTQTHAWDHMTEVP